MCEVDTMPKRPLETPSRPKSSPASTPSIGAKRRAAATPQKKSRASHGSTELKQHQTVTEELRRFRDAFEKNILAKKTGTLSFKEKFVEATIEKKAADGIVLFSVKRPSLQPMAANEKDALTAFQRIVIEIREKLIRD